MKLGCLFLAVTLCAADRLALQGLDPVRLTAGAETAGREDLTESRSGFLYRFASEASRTEFRREPQRFEIQWEGACGKMGPASGAGSPDRWLVHDGRIYVFASDSCKRTFESNPAAHLERVETPPPHTKAQSAQARKLLDKAARYISPSLDRVTTLHLRWETASERKKYAHTHRAYWFRFPDDARHDDEYAEWGAESHRLTASAAAIVTPSSSTPMTPSARTVIHRDLAVELIPLLRARRQPGFEAWQEAPGRIGIAFRGAIRTLDIAPDTGEIRRISYRGRGPGGPFGDITESYSEWKPAHGLRIPHRVETTLNAKPWPSRSLRIVKAEVNTTLHDTVFQTAAKASADGR